MSCSDKPILEMRFDSLTDRFRNSLSCDPNKPDFKDVVMDSPVSHIRTRRFSGGLSAVTSSGSSSSSSSSGSVPVRNSPNPVSRMLENSSDSHFGESSYRRSDCSSGGGGGSVNSPPLNILPAGNICPSGRILKTGMANRKTSRIDVLGTGTGNYGHGSIVRGGVSEKSGGGDPTMANFKGNVDPEEVKRAGNEQHRKGHFGEALSLYDQAISLSPRNAAYRSNRAAALTGLGRLPEAVKECEEAIKLDPGYGRAHQRLVSLLMRLGHVENARRRLSISGQQPDQADLNKLQLVEKHLKKCCDARKVGDWRSTLREADAAVAIGIDSSPQILACKAEALLKLHQLDDANSTFSTIPRYDPLTGSCSQTKFFGILCEAYLFFVQAQIEMALGRFENAVTAAEKAGQIDPQNIEVSVLLNNVRFVARARARGNDLFKSERFTEACSAYEQGLRFCPSNSVLYCNRAACWYKLGLWERSVEDCDQALQVQHNYTKALLRRATSNAKLGLWVEAVRDYEALRNELPNDNEVAEFLFHAQVALQKSHKEVSNAKLGGEVEEVSGLDQYKAAVSSPGVSVVHFRAASNTQCKQITPFVDTLCGRYPSINFLEVDVEGCPAVADNENVRVVPTFKIFRSGVRVKEMTCPSRQVLEYSVRHYGF